MVSETLAEHVAVRRLSSGHYNGWYEASMTGEHGCTWTSVAETLDGAELGVLVAAGLLCPLVTVSEIVIFDPMRSGLNPGYVDLETPLKRIVVVPARVRRPKDWRRYQ